MPAQGLGLVSHPLAHLLQDRLTFVPVPQAVSSFGNFDTMRVG